MNKAYTVIPLEKLESVRAELNAKLKLLSETDGVRYGLRTFYLGPRQKARYGSYPGQTLKSQARAAKIGVYEFEFDLHSGRYVPTNLLHYV
jgi:hypothetical protein